MGASRSHAKPVKEIDRTLLGFSEERNPSLTTVTLTRSND